MYCAQPRVFKTKLSKNENSNLKPARLAQDIQLQISLKLKYWNLIEVMVQEELLKHLANNTE